MDVIFDTVHTGGKVETYSSVS